MIVSLDVTCYYNIDSILNMSESLFRRSRNTSKKAFRYTLPKLMPMLMVNAPNPSLKI